MARNVAIEIHPPELRRRLWQIIPGALSWITLIGLTVLAFVVPFWVAIFVIAYDVYVLIRAVYMSIHLVYAYRRLKWMQGINWLQRVQGVSQNLTAYLSELKAQKHPASRRRSLALHRKEVERMIQEKRTILPWQKIHHYIVIPTYDESLEVLRTTVAALARSDFPKERMHVVVGFEERAGQSARERAGALEQEYGGLFGTFIAAFHPDGLPGEKRVKSANATWAIQQLEQTLAPQALEREYVVVSNFDSDTVVSPSYFSYLTYVFITHPDRYHVSYQPIPLYNNNLWDAPSFSRVIATGSTFWQLIESTRPERLVTFSSHSMSLMALQDVGYWQRDIISEDSRIFWQCLIHYNGHYRTEPLHTTVSMDAALAPTWWQTLQNQYKQKRRWAWGIENFPYLAESFWGNKQIPLRTKFSYVFRTLEGHYSWATAAIIVAGLGWLPVFFGGPDFHATVLSYSLPRAARTIMSVAMGGLLISATISIFLLPPRPGQYGRWRYGLIIAQWVLVPVIATVLSAFPALDAETRLMFGRDLHFNVMQKSRRARHPSHAV